MSVDLGYFYPVLILLSSVGMGMMVSAGDLLTLYVGLELQSLSAYVLAALPVMVTIALFLISNEYASALLAPTFLRIVFFIAIGMAFVGFLIMRKIAAIDV